MHICGPINNGMGELIRQRVMPADTYDVGDYPVERLQAYADETNRAIKAGLPVPLVDVHCDVDDPRSALNNRGWVKELFVEDGWLGYELDVTDDHAAVAIKNGSIKFTSPEFRESRKYNHIGLVGPHVRHVALTHKPRNPKQGPFEIVGEGIARFSLDEEDMADENDDKTEEKTEDVDTSSEMTNPDMPKDDKGNQVMEAIVAQLDAVGICVPADWSFESEGAADILLAALKTCQAAKAAAEPEQKEDSEKAPEVTESQTPVAFSEDELAKYPPEIAAALRERDALKAQAVQFSEEKAGIKRKDATSLVESKLANVPALRSKLLERLSAVQFSESGEQATLTISEAAEMFAAALPPNLQFSEEGVTVADHQAGDKFFESKPGEVSEEEAEAIVDRMFKRGK